jgi:four helix bundle protein
MKSYKDLEIYKESKKLAILVHNMTLTLPKFEMFEEASQVRRSSKSVTSMIVEGYGRRKYKADFIRYLVYSHTECDETILHLEFLYETESLKDKTLFDSLKSQYESLSKRINKYILWVEDHWNEFPAPESPAT